MLGSGYKRELKDFMRKTVVESLWIIAIVIFISLDIYITAYYPEKKKIMDIILFLFLFYILCLSCQRAIATKKLTHIIRLIVLLFIYVVFAYSYISKHYPQYVPSFMIEYRSNRLKKQHKDFIDEVLVLHENERKGNFDAFSYGLQILIEHEHWLENNKSFIDRHINLKEYLVQEFQKIIDEFKNAAHDEDSFGYYIVVYFKEYLQKVN